MGETRLTNAVTVPLPRRRLRDELNPGTLDSIGEDLPALQVRVA